METNKLFIETKKPKHWNRNMVTLTLAAPTPPLESSMLAGSNEACRLARWSDGQRKRVRRSLKIVLEDKRWWRGGQKWRGSVESRVKPRVRLVAPDRIDGACRHVVDCRQHQHPKAEALAWFRPAKLIKKCVSLYQWNSLVHALYTTKSRHFIVTFIWVFKMLPRFSPWNDCCFRAIFVGSGWSGRKHSRIIGSSDIWKRSWFYRSVQQTLSES